MCNYTNTVVVTLHLPYASQLLLPQALTLVMHNPLFELTQTKNIIPHLEEGAHLSCLC